MKRLIKSIFKTDGVRKLICFLISIYLRSVHVTSTWHRNEEDYLAPLYRKGDPFIIVLWHSRVMMMPFAWRYKDKVTIFTSDHPDGRLVAYSMGWFGFDALFGSTKRTEMKTLREIVRRIKQGQIFGMTPDGPRGPSMRLKPGVISIARMAGVPIIPVTYATNRRVQLNTWDRMTMPLPFGRGVFLWGKPLSIPRDADTEMQERFREELEQRCIDLCRQAEREAGNVFDEAQIDGQRLAKRDAV